MLPKPQDFAPTPDATLMPTLRDLGNRLMLAGGIRQ